MTRHGYHVLEATDASEAPAVWGANRSEIDLKPAGMEIPAELSGLQFGQRSMAERPGLKGMFTSGYLTEQSDSQSIAEPSVRYLPRPYPPKNLLEAIGDGSRPGHRQSPV